MPRRKKTVTEEPIKRKPAVSLEAKEQEMISLAVDLAEQQLRDGTASAQVITHYLRLGTTNNRLEQEKLEQENAMLRAKTEALQSQKHVEELYAAAIAAMRHYSGEPDD